MTETRTPVRRRHSAKLSRQASEAAVAYIRQSFSSQRYPVTYAARVLSCNYRTAQRILEVKRPFNARLRKVYVERMARYTGVPFERIANVEVEEYATTIVDWARTNPASQATRAAAMIGAGIATRAMVVHGLIADFAVIHAQDGRPSVIRISVQTADDTRHIITLRAAADLTSILEYTPPTGGQRCQVAATAARVDTILKLLKKHAKQTNNGPVKPR